MNKGFDNEFRELVCEIVFFVILLVVMVPICVNASNNYRESVKKIEKCVDIRVSIDNVDGEKFVVLENIGDEEEIDVNLVLKISDFSNNYMISLNGEEFYLSDLESTYDGNFYYYDLGNYNVGGIEIIEYEMALVGEEIYIDNISYSFIAEVLFC